MGSASRTVSARPGAAVAIAIAIAWSTAGDAAAAERVPTPADAAGADLLEALTGWNVVLYGAAAGETAALAFGGGDQTARVIVREGIALPAWGNTAYVAGYVLPVIVAPGIWIAGLALGDRATIGAGSAAVQALVFAAAATALLKWSTGRPYPLHGGDPRAPDVLEHPEYARQFAPFNLRGDWAWPSGHTSAATSIVAALAGWDPDCIAIPLIGYPISAAIGLGMIVGDHHWTSDVIAGALIGYAFGSSVGRSFRRRARGETGQDRAIRIVPVGPGAVGGAVVGVW